MKREWLKEIRQSKKYTQKFVAGKVEINQTYYSLIESGKRNPSINISKRIAKTLGFNWVTFFPDTKKEIK